jgi:hypothetical protein
VASDPDPKGAKKDTGVKAAKMSEPDAILNKRVSRLTGQIEGMITEGRLAEACCLLFYMHKLHIQEWVLVKRSLLALPRSSKSLQTVATLLEASKRSTLQESSCYIPGLGSLIRTNYIQDLG